VDKTRLGVSVALAAARRLGGKVLVLTIDPAKRLADALGLEGIGNVERRVPGEAFKAGGLEVRGELWAAMLDTKQSWDALVLRHAPDPETAYRILDNRMYENITARFVQSHDYIAMERLFEIHETGQFDLIVIDTPPSRNALDFLDAPNRMAEFFGGRLLRWLTMPYRVGGRRGARVINVASRPFYQMADRLLGSQFLQDIAEFFLNFQSMYEGFVERARAVERLLHDKRTTFAVVTTLESAPLREAEHFCVELGRRNFHLGALVLNRTLPRYLLSAEGDRAANTLCADSGPLAAELADTGVDAFADQARDARVLTTIGESFRNFAVVAKREAELRAELARVPDVVADVPAFASDIGDISGLARIAEHLLPSG
jgi:anion-transporting  ArsA/GET3 family ATPase